MKTWAPHAFSGLRQVRFMGVVSHRRSEFRTAGVHPKCESDPFAATSSLPSQGWLQAGWPASPFLLWCASTSSSRLLMKLWALSRHVEVGREKKEVGKGIGEMVWGRPLKPAVCVMATLRSCLNCRQSSLGGPLPPPLQLLPAAHRTASAEPGKLASAQDAFLTYHSHHHCSD